MEMKRHGPKKGAARKWAQRLKELGNQPPPKELMDKINAAEKVELADEEKKNLVSDEN